MPNNGIYDDRKSINGASPIKLLTFKPFAIISFVKNFRKHTLLFPPNKYMMMTTTCYLIACNLFSNYLPFTISNTSASSYITQRLYGS